METGVTLFLEEKFQMGYRHPQPARQPLILVNNQKSSHLGFYVKVVIKTVQIKVLWLLSHTTNTKNLKFQKKNLKVPNLSKFTLVTAVTTSYLLQASITKFTTTKFVAQLRNQLTATQFVRSFENTAPGVEKYKVADETVEGYPYQIRCSAQYCLCNGTEACEFFLLHTSPLPHTSTAPAASSPSTNPRPYILPYPMPLGR